MENCKHCPDHDVIEAKNEERDRKIRRICEDTTSLKVQLDDLKQVGVHITYIKIAVDKINTKLEHDYVSVSEFTPIKIAVYGMVGLITITVFGGILGKILK